MKGAITIAPDTVEIKGELPFMLAIFKGKIASVLQRHVAEALA